MQKISSETILFSALLFLAAFLCNGCAGQDRKPPLSPDSATDKRILSDQADVSATNTQHDALKKSDSPPSTDRSETKMMAADIAKKAAANKSRTEIYKRRTYGVGSIKRYRPSSSADKTSPRRRADHFQF